MTQFDIIFEQLMAVEGNGWIYDEIDLQQLGVSKRDFVKKTKSVPFAKGNPPNTVTCPHCNRKIRVSEFQSSK